jgi:serine/threonine-protein kinase SRPK3
MMNGGDIKKQAINQTKKLATAAANTTNVSNGQKKRRKGENLKPIITTDGPVAVEVPHITSSNNPAG